MVNVLVYPIINGAESAKRIKALRKAASLSVSDIQKVLGVSSQAIYSWENDNLTSLPSLDNLVVLAYLYDTTIDNMLVVNYLAIKPENEDYANSLNAIASQLTSTEMKRIMTRYECFCNIKEMMTPKNTSEHKNN